MRSRVWPTSDLSKILMRVTISLVFGSLLLTCKFYLLLSTNLAPYTSRQ